VVEPHHISVVDAPVDPGIVGEAIEQAEHRGPEPAPPFSLVGRYEFHAARVPRRHLAGGRAVGVWPVASALAEVIGGGRKPGVPRRSA
jgi:hypothetical protein